MCVKWVCAQERMTNKKVEIHREQYLCSAVAKDVSRLHGAGKRDIVSPCPLTTPLSVAQTFVLKMNFCG